MIIAVTAAGRSLDSPMDARFGRAGYFHVIDTDSDMYEVIENREGMEAMQGAGIHAAELVAGKGAEVVITGHCGPKAYEVLSGAGIKVVLCGGGTVEKAVAKFLSGELEEIAGPDVNSHWG